MLQYAGIAKYGKVVKYGKHWQPDKLTFGMDHHHYLCVHWIPHTHRWIVSAYIVRGQLTPHCSTLPRKG